MNWAALTVASTFTVFTILFVTMQVREEFNCRRRARKRERLHYFRR